MAKYITGTLISNEAGAVYEDHVYDRFLRLKLENGQILSIFDPPGSYGPISQELSVNERYEMILATLPAPGSVSYNEIDSSFGQEDIWHGTILATHWVPSAVGNYKTAHHYLCDREWFLLSTSIGNLLMGSRALPLSEGTKGKLVWKNMRLDLCAVL